MSAGDENFLSRWSQRKHEASQSASETPGEKTNDVPEPPSEPVAEHAAESEFDLASLPKLEEITEGSDITGFLKKGVPESLRNAALRKSWALDPAIRNYVSPALEYAYDWNTPGGVPGSGELGAGVDVARIVAQIMGTVESEDAAPGQASVAASNEKLPKVAETDQEESSSSDSARGEVRAPDSNTFVQLQSDGVSSTAAPDANCNAQHSLGAMQQAVRRHGSAKPKA